MGLRITTNLASMSASRALYKNSQQQARSYERIASGNRILSGADDPAGLVVSEHLKSQIRSVSQAERNTNDAISLVQVAEGSLSEIGGRMIRLRELAIQAGTDTLGDKERLMIEEEYRSIIQEIDRLATVTTFNGTPLLSASSDKDELEFQVGIYDTPVDRLVFPVNEFDMRSDALGIEGLSVATIDDARDSLDGVDEAIHRVSLARARLGAVQTNLQGTSSNLWILRENLSQAKSRIADADLATETSDLVRNNILQQAAVAILAQANNMPTMALRLL